MPSSSSSKIQEISHWKMGSRGSLKCIICNDNIWRDSKSADAHVQTERHRRAAGRVEVHRHGNSSGRNHAQLRDTSPESSSSSSEQLPLFVTDGRASTPLTNASQNAIHRSLNHICGVYLQNKEKEWFPWPDKLTCLLDIIRHLPSTTLTKEKNSTIMWGLQMLLTSQIPSDSHMKLITALLQKMYGTETFMIEGALGNTFYINNILRIIAQEVANPEVRPYLQFFPELTSGPIANTFQGCRWLWDHEADLTTPMIRYNGQDFYLFEPCMLSNGAFYIPIRWFKRSGTLYGIICDLLCIETDTGKAWVVLYDNQREMQENELEVSFPVLLNSYKHREVADPRRILGIRRNNETEIKPWSLTDPLLGNSWRAKAMGHQVLAFPIFLFCEISGELSKGLNYNSFLFTAAGLSHEHMNHQYNVHFLCASPTADPLEMMEGIQRQIHGGQENGVWAWDCSSNEVVLLIPSILALLGNESVQSKFASHTNSEDGLFCRMCVACKNNRSSPPGVEGNIEFEGDEEMRRQKIQTTVEQYHEQAVAYYTVSDTRSKANTARQAQDAFNAVKAFGRDDVAKEIEMNLGIKDHFQSYFISKTLSFISNLHGSDTEKQSTLSTFLTSLPENVSNPVWGIQGFDPHRHTLIEISDVVLLGFVRHFWIDAITSISSYDKEIISSRLQSYNTSGLEFGFLSGGRFVRDPGSLSKMDYKAIVQAAPFVLYDLVPNYVYDAWIALCRLVPLVWQPIIPELEEYIDMLEAAIHNFLALSLRYSLKWLHMSYFHTILHLPQNIRDFGPSSNFSADKFEFYRSLIQKHSIDYTSEAPSRDVGRAFASANRLRHLLSGGKVLVENEYGVHDRPSTQGQVPQSENYVSSGHAVVGLWEQDSNLRRIFGYPLCNNEIKKEVTRLLHPATNIPYPAGNWDQTLSAQVINEVTGLKLRLLTKKISKCSSFVLENGDRCSLNEWVVLSSSSRTLSIFKIMEILQISGPSAHLSNKPDAVLVLQFRAIDDDFAPYGMPRLSSTGFYDLVDPKEILCVANVQHNCSSNSCRTNSKKGALILEGHDIQARMMGVTHVNTDDIILNCSQLRNHQLIHFLCRQTSKEIPFEAAIRESVERKTTDCQWREDAIQASQMEEFKVLDSIPEISESEQYSADFDGSFDEEVASECSVIMEETEGNDYDESLQYNNIY